MCLLMGLVWKLPLNPKYKCIPSVFYWSRILCCFGHFLVLLLSLHCMFIHLQYLGVKMRMFTFMIWLDPSIPVSTSFRYQSTFHILSITMHHQFSAPWSIFLHPNEDQLFPCAAGSRIISHKRCLEPRWKLAGFIWFRWHCYCMEESKDYHKQELIDETVARNFDRTQSYMKSLLLDS